MRFSRAMSSHQSRLVASSLAPICKGYFCGVSLSQDPQNYNKRSCCCENVIKIPRACHLRSYDTWLLAGTGLRMCHTNLWREAATVIALKSASVLFDTLVPGMGVWAWVWFCGWISDVMGSKPFSNESSIRLTYFQSNR